MAFRARNVFGTFEKRAPGARFLKAPKLCGAFSRVTIPIVSQEWRGFKSSNFTVLFLFLPCKHVKRSAFQNKRLAVSRMVFGVRNVFGTFEKRAPDLNTLSWNEHLDYMPRIGSTTLSLLKRNLRFESTRLEIQQ